VRVGTVRYEPGRKVLVRYEVELDQTVATVVGEISSSGRLAGVAARPSSHALAALAARRSPVTTPLVYEPALDLLLQWLPLDVRLPALAEPTERLRERLRAAGLDVGPGGGGPSLLSYRPRRHAVLRFGRHILRLYSADHALRNGVSALRFYSTVPAVRTPRLEAVVPELRLAVQTLLPGARQTDSAASAAIAGALLAALHGARGEYQGPLRVATPRDHLTRAVRTAACVTVLAPELAGTLRKLVRTLVETTPASGSLVPSHGDFAVVQLLKSCAGFGLVDLDRLRLAPRALDPATYAAHLVRGRPGDLDAALAVLENLVFGYGRRPADLSWYLATMILRRAARPFHRFDTDWPNGLAEMVASAEEAFAS
jgi:hypothetical protein